jgi:hypothetical protein
MTAKILTFPTLVLPPDVVLRSEVPPDALPTTDLTPPLANRFAHVCDAPKRRKPRAKMRVEQIEVTCVKVPRKQHADLRTLSGVLTLDWKGDVPWTATFDPDEESIPNIVAPIVGGLKRSDDAIEIACDEGTWVFAPLAEDDEDGDEDEE